MFKWAGPAVRFLSWTPVAVLFSDTVATIHVASTEQMAPQVPPNSICLVRRISSRRKSYGHGHVVLVKPPHPSSKTVIRRVIALGGDYVQLKNQPEDQYVPFGFVWVEADFTELQSGVPCHGKIPAASIVGRVTHVLPSTHPLQPQPSNRAFPLTNV